MICDHCEEEIIGDAVCLNCLKIAIFENQPKKVKKTPLELAAGDLLDACEKAKDRLETYIIMYNEIVEDEDLFFNVSKEVAFLNTIIIKVKTQGNQSPQANPPAQDEHKSAP